MTLIYVISYRIGIAPGLAYATRQYGSKKMVK